MIILMRCFYSIWYHDIAQSWILFHFIDPWVRCLLLEFPQWSAL